MRCSTYGGVSLFVVAFAVYPFAAELFRQSNIPKRLIPATVALGVSPSPWMPCQAHRRSRYIIPTSFFGTNAWAAPWLGLIGSVFIIVVGLVYLERQRRKAQAKNEGYGTELLNEPETPDNINLPNPIIAISPLILVGVFKPAVYPLDPTMVWRHASTGASGSRQTDYHRSR